MKLSSFSVSFCPDRRVDRPRCIGARWVIRALTLAAALTAVLARGATPKPVISYSPASDVLTLGVAITTISPTNTGGVATAWSISPSLPQGLAFSNASGQISGTPEVLQVATKYTVGATNAGGTGSTTLKLAVVAVAPTLSYNPDSATFTKGTAITPLVPTTGGGPVVTWSIKPALSAGLNFDTATGSISGTPTALKAATVYSVKATNTGGNATASLTFTVVDLPPAIAYAPASYTYAVGKAIKTISPTSTGGAVVSWSVSPALPAGLALSATSGKITGTPTAASPTTGYTVRAENTGGTATASLTLTVLDQAPAFSYIPATYAFTINTPIPTLSPVSTGGPVASWSISPALGAGLTLDPASGQITGTPTVAKARTSYTVKATNVVGSATTTLAITINDLPPAIGYPVTTFLFTKGQAISPIIPTSSGGAIGSWSVGPALPAGLALNAGTGQITGTPGAVAATLLYTVTASNGVGSAQVGLTITVNDIPPIFSYNPASYTLTKGQAAGPITPTNTGGTVVTWSIAPALPAGLALDPSTGAVSGTPTAFTPATQYTVTGTNSGGTATASFFLAVLDQPVTPTVGLATFLSAGKAGLGASTQDQGQGMIYTWTLTGGTLTAGQGTPSITFTAGGPGTLTAAVKVSNALGSASGSATATVVPMPIARLAIPSSVHPGDSWMQAGLPVQSGMSYLWTETDGTAGGNITSGQGTNAIAFSVGMTAGTFQIQADVQNQAGDSASASATVTVQNGTWLVENGGLAGPEASGTLTVLADGRLLLAGGMSTGSGINAEIFDPATLAWFPTGPMTTVRSGHTATLLQDGTVLVAGGSGTAAGQTSEVFDPATGLWTATAGSMVMARTSHTATLLTDGTVLVAGGSGTAGQISELYNPVTGLWAVTAGTMTTSRYGHTASLLADGTVLVAGGEDTHVSMAPLTLTSCEIYNPVTGSWTTASDMIEKRERHTAVTLADGRVLAISGTYNDYHPWTFVTNSSEIYDPATNTWTLTTGSLTVGREGFPAIRLQDGRVLVAGGLGFLRRNPMGGYILGPIGDAEAFDPTTGQWTVLASLNLVRDFQGGALLPDGTALILGGVSGSIGLASSERFDPGAGTWSFWPAAQGTARWAHTSTLLGDGSLLVAGGSGTGNPALASSEIYDPVGRAWRPTAGPLNTGRYGHSSTLMSDGTVLAAGGYTSPGGATASVEIYSPVTGTWNGSAPAMETARYNHTATWLADGRVLVVGGDTSGSACEIYDPSGGMWSATASLNTARTGHSAVLLKTGTVLVVGGAGAGSSALATCEVFDPVAGTWSYTGSLGTPRTGQTATLLTNGAVLVTGGLTDQEVPAGSELYDPTTATWSATLGAPIQARDGHSAVLLQDGTVLVAGGEGNNGLVPIAERYDPTTGQWSSAGLLNSGRISPTLQQLPDGTVVLAFGYYADTVTEIFLPSP